MLEIYTDGSSLGNPGPGGWGVVFVFTDKQLAIADENYKDKKEKSKSHIIEISGGEKNTTNNRMELTAVIEALKFLELKNSNFLSSKAVVIYTDSAYVLGGVTSWLSNWQRNGWRTANKKEVLNQDLWKELDNLIKNFKNEISWKKVKGHSGHIYNDKADEIATKIALLQ